MAETATPSLTDRYLPEPFAHNVTELREED